MKNDNNKAARSMWSFPVNGNVQYLNKCLYVTSKVSLSGMASLREIVRKRLWLAVTWRHLRPDWRSSECSPGWVDSDNLIGRVKMLTRSFLTWNRRWNTRLYLGGTRNFLLPYVVIDWFIKLNLKLSKSTDTEWWEAARLSNLRVNYS